MYSSESVSEGHPDKLADQISDAILDSYLAADPDARVACETMVKSGVVVVAGEIKSAADRPDVAALVRGVVADVGYISAEVGFDANSCGVIDLLGQQSADISAGVDRKNGEQGAGDQGMMFGYACDETDTYMPLAIDCAHRLVRRQAELRRGSLGWLRPDAKSQVAVLYEDSVPKEIQAVVLSTQHAPDVSDSTLRKAVREEIIDPVLESMPVPVASDMSCYINPAGRFVSGGPEADCGLTGRKIIVDTYGGMAHHGGGAFSGKDPSKVDRSAAYAARYVAVNIVAAKLARRCELQISYAIGVAEPVSVSVQSYGTGTVSDRVIERAVREVFDLTPAGINGMLGLNRPMYRQTAAYGHFGRNDISLPWEQRDRVDPLREAAV